MTYIVIDTGHEDEDCNRDKITLVGVYSDFYEAEAADLERFDNGHKCLIFQVGE